MPLNKSSPEWCKFVDEIMIAKSPHKDFRKHLFQQVIFTLTFMAVPTEQIKYDSVGKYITKMVDALEQEYLLIDDATRPLLGMYHVSDYLKTRVKPDHFNNVP